MALPVSRAASGRLFAEFMGGFYLIQSLKFLVQYFCVLMCFLRFPYTSQNPNLGSIRHKSLTPNAVMANLWMDVFVPPVVRKTRPNHASVTSIFHPVFPWVLISISDLFLSILMQETRGSFYKIPNSKHFPFPSSPTTQLFLPVVNSDIDLLIQQGVTMQLQLAGHC